MYMYYYNITPNNELQIHKLVGVGAEEMGWD